MTYPPAVTYLGHSTILIEMDGMRILTDPILRSRIAFLRRTRPAIDPAMFQNIDAVLISHLHYDHLDFASLRILGEKVKLIIPHGSEPILRKHGFYNTQEVRIGETIRIGALTVKTVMADHVRSRYPLGPASDCIGFVVGASASIYFPGDTRTFPEMAALAEDNLDLVLMPVWGWGPDHGRMHMGPREAAEALEMLRPSLAIPIHWGTFIPFWLRWMQPGFYYLPPLIFAEHARKITPPVEVHILQPGESLTLVGSGISNSRASKAKPN